MNETAIIIENGVVVVSGMVGVAQSVFRQSLLKNITTDDSCTIQ